MGIVAGACILLNFGFRVHVMSDANLKREPGGRPQAVLIAGPTASGKSALALDVATRLGGTVVNADSMQVYDVLRVLTARPEADELSRAPHVLYGHVDPRERYSAGRFADDARDVIAACVQDNTIPIFTGGTGLYFRTLLEGLSPIPAVNDETRDRIAAQVGRDGIDAARARLAGVDPVLAARQPAMDGQRLVRALSVFEATGKPLSDWQAIPGVPLLHRDQVACVFLDPQREALYARIDARFETMVARGALDEVRALLKLTDDTTLPAMRAHGVPHLRRQLAGAMTLPEAAEKSQADTRQYAKRQKTWFRHQMHGWDTLDPDDKEARKRWLAGF